MSETEIIEERSVEFTDIVVDPDVQCRVEIDQAVVDEYAERMRAGDQFPPMVLFDVDGKLIMGDGFHRLAAYKDEGKGRLAAPCKILKGTRADAIWYAAGANREHGLRRSNADKRRAVLAALKARPESSDNAIGDHCGVDHKTVGTWRQRSTREIPKSTKRVGKDGRKTDTSKIGKKPKTAKVATKDKAPVPAEEPPATVPPQAEPVAPVQADDAWPATPRELARKAAKDESPTSAERAPAIEPPAQPGPASDEAARPTEQVVGDSTEEVERPLAAPGNEQSTRKSVGVGIRYAHNAINLLSKIPLKDPLRKEGFRTVSQWIEDNK